MRTLLAMLFLCICLNGKAQKDSTNPSSSYQSFSGRYYLLGESPYKIPLTVSFEINEDTLVLHTPDKTSKWCLNFFNQSVDKEITIDSYTSRSPEGMVVNIRFIYEHNELVDIVFSQGIFSYHFFISYPKFL